MKVVILAVIQLILLHSVNAQFSKDEHFYLLIGTYTSPGKSEGIYVYDFDSKTGAFNYKTKSPATENPSYLSVSRDQKKVYAVSEVGKGKGGISAFHFDPLTAELTYINSAPTGGAPCYVEVDSADNFVFGANYGGGSLCAVRVNADGSLDTNVQKIQHEGHGIDSVNQSKPHVHSTVLSPDNKYLLSADLGLDKIFVYKFDSTSATPLTPMEPAYVDTKPGVGPRHITFHPNGKFVYVVNEMGGSVNAYNYNDGKLTPLDSITMLPPGFSGIIEAADIHISADGKFLYATNREVSNELLIYSISKNGTLKYAGRQSTLGKGPRSFAIDPTGKFVLVANGNSDEIIIFSRNPKTGLVKFTGKKIEMSKPVCLKFITAGK
ncbi:MAG: lactonase family protein [Flavitalea sp.]